MRLLFGIFLMSVSVLLLGCSPQDTTVNETSSPEPQETPVTAGSTPEPRRTPVAQDPTPEPRRPSTTVIAIPEPREVQLRILDINDFHGAIATSSDAFGGVGRADCLAANIAAARAEAENSVFVSAGDLIGASPLISALFHDEPTIEAMNLMGLDFNSVGNHEFDDGLAELFRMQRGGAHPEESELLQGADFRFLAANVIDDNAGNAIFPAYGVRDFQGIGVAFIGLTLEGTPGIVARGRGEGLTFLDEADAVNSLVPEILEQEIQAIVVLLHLGGFSDGGKDDCGNGLEGPVAEVVARLDPAVDLVIAAHTNDEFVCEIDGKWVTMADYGSRLLTVIDATLNSDTGDLTVRAAANRPNSRAGVTPVPALTELIERYDRLSAPRANAVVGTVTADINQEQNDAGESALGDVLADAHLAATSSPDTGNAVIAFMNPGGIRDNITFASSGPEGDDEVTYGEAFAVHPWQASRTNVSARITTTAEISLRQLNSATPFETG